MKDKAELYALIDEYWQDYSENYSLNCILKPSVPVIWFGNIDKYFESPCRVMTVAINPSFNEFKDNNGTLSFVRFPLAKNLINKKALSRDEKDNLIEAYNNYFETEPYKKWFDGFDKILKERLNTGDKTSYYDAEYVVNRAIHLDLNTSLTTSIGWSQVSDEDKERLSKKGKELFNKLLAYLEPTIILFTAKDDELQDALKTFAKNGIEIMKDTSSRGKRNIRGFYFNDSLLIYGTNGDRGPMTGVGKETLKRISSIVEEYKSMK